MSTESAVITPSELELFNNLANAIQDEAKKANALALLERMATCIEGVGDRPITWLPTQIKILQNMSNMDNISADDPRAVTAGAIVANNFVLPQGIKVIPLMFWNGRSLWDPDPNNSRKLCSSPDSKIGWAHGSCYECAFSKAPDGEQIPPCSKEFVFLVIAEDLSDIYRVTFAKSQYRNGMDWSKEVIASRTHPHKRIYSLVTEASEKKKTIKVLKAKMEDVRTANFTPDVMAFLDAMSKKQLADRKNYLEDYHNYVNKRIAMVNAEAGERALPNESVQEYLPKPDEGGASDSGIPNYDL
ncbi:MAG TPA: hypothetical protein VFM18_06265 [Methanosarcina sp.]|nr:hypothetical protein [Methanosarcina sp.]